MVEVENRVERSQPLSFFLEDDFQFIPLAIDLPDLGLKVGVVVESQGFGRLLDVVVLFAPLFVIGQHEITEMLLLALTSCPAALLHTASGSICWLRKRGLAP